ncbi:MAG: hypothetical protein RLZZ352_907 [Pseudomonadota bacterium]
MKMHAKQSHTTRLLAVLLCAVGLSGCTVLAVVDTAASAAVGVAGVAVDAAVGTVKLGGKVVGKATDAVLGTDK